MIFVLAVLPAGVSASPMILGLENKHSLTSVQQGDLIVGEMRCAACHKADQGRWLLEKAGPNLLEVGSRVSPLYLERFIASPSSVHPGTTMPDVLAGQSDEQRAEIAKAISHFLIAQSEQAFSSTPTTADDLKLGKELFHTVGCIACHSPLKEDGARKLGDGEKSLAHVAGKYSLKSLSEFLFQPHRVRPSGRMPDMKLTRIESKAIASFLIGDAVKEIASLKPVDDLVANGRRYFQQFNCAACHQMADIAPAPQAGLLSTLDTSRGCLSGEAGKHPQFHFNEKQLKAIRTSLEAKKQNTSDKDRIDITLVTFNCVSCHVRDDFGGVSEARNEWFKTTEQNLGDHARIPPELTKVGAKLQRLWLQKVLFDGESVRPYMLTRMPQYGEANLRHLPDLVERVDTIKQVEMPTPVKEQEKLFRAAGHQLLGDQGLNCVICHTFNGKASQSFKGIDLMTSFQRLKPSWFYHFMLEPAVHRPGIIMPTYWPDGKAVRTDILDGETDSQIKAMWYYLSLGTSARDPSGLVAVDSKLSVSDKTRTYRGRSSIAGYRGIAVGFPQGISYAFNAETGTLSGIWRGEFISVGRSGQGSGGFNPAARAITLAQDVSIIALADERAPWPLKPVMTKEAPVNPDPLYPRNLGYEFKGYSLDERSIPTFVYQSGEVRIEDRSEPDASKQTPTLVRVLKFTSPAARTLWFRAMTGKIDSETEQRFQTTGWALEIPKLRAALRPMEAGDNAEKNAGNKAQELLLKFDIPKGESTIKLIYEITQK